MTIRQGLVVCIPLVLACRSPSTGDFMAVAWDTYRARYLDPAGYVVDVWRDTGGAVTSEGQGYALLRAVWEDDPDTFRTVSAWTREHLLRDDGLHSWLWSSSEQRVVDPNSATDGDLEIAWAHALAAEVFAEPAYARQAAAILRAVRAHAAVSLGSDWFPAAGNWAVGPRIINLSYFVPYAHPWFAALDPDGAWEGVSRTGYELLERALAEHVLPPAFLELGTDGSLSDPPEDAGLESDFSFDAVRLFWRVEADCALTNRPAACGDPLRTRSAAEVLVRDGRILTRYARDGTVLADDESLTFYAALLPSFRRHAPELVAPILEPRLRGAPVRDLLRSDRRYYDHNWVWFGLALDRGLIAARTPRPPITPTRD